MNVVIFQPIEPPYNLTSTECSSIMTLIISLMLSAGFQFLREGIVAYVRHWTEIITVPPAAKISAGLIF